MSFEASSRGERVAALFHEVAELGAEQRVRLYDARSVPEDVRREVESLLGESLHGAFADDMVTTAGERIADVLSDEVEAWRPGARVGDYEIVREIARGGMGVVFEAQQLTVGRRVALKVIRAGFGGSANRQRFRAEVEAIARLEHPGIVPVYDVAEFDDLPFFSMAYMAGGSLSELGAPVDPRRAAELMIAVCDTVHYAHSRNIVHRDLKPANVLLDESGVPRVSDFGLAKDTTDDSELTHSGAILGTPGFMAPEQARGAGGPGISHLADVYGLGGVLYYLVAGRAPLQGDHLADTLHKVLHEDPADPRRFEPGVPVDLSSICLKALEKEPVKRYGSAAAMAVDLRRFVAGQTPTARPLTGRARLMRWCRRNPALSALSAVTILAVVGGGAAATWFAVEADRRAADLASTNGALQTRNLELAQARDEASDSRADAEAFSDFLIHDVMAAARSVDGAGGLGVDVSVKDALLAAIPALTVRFEGRRLAEALARTELAKALRRTHEVAAAIEQLELAVAAWSGELGEGHREALGAMNSLGTAYFQNREFDRAIEIFRTILSQLSDDDPEFRTRVLLNLAANYQMSGRFSEVVEVLETAADSAVDTLKPRLIARLAEAHARLGEEKKARVLIARAHEAADAVADLTPAERLEIYLENLSMLEALEDDEGIVEFTPPVLEAVRVLHSPNGPRARQISDVLSQALERTGRTREAAAEARRTVDMLGQRNLPRDRWRIERCARLFLEVGEGLQAKIVARMAQERWLRIDPDDPQAFAAEALLCDALIATGEKQQARELLRLRLPRLRELERAAKQTAAETAPRFAEVLATFESIDARLGSERSP